MEVQIILNTLAFIQLDNYLNIVLSKYLSMNAVFKALNDTTRREILIMLRKRDLTAGDIAAKFDMTKPSISHHLDLLRQANLVISMKEGQFVYYSLNMAKINEVKDWAAQFEEQGSLV